MNPVSPFPPYLILSFLFMCKFCNVFSSALLVSLRNYTVQLRGEETQALRATLPPRQQEPRRTEILTLGGVITVLKCMTQRVQGLDTTCNGGFHFKAEQKGICKRKEELNSITMPDSLRRPLDRSWYKPGSKTSDVAQ